MTSETISHSRQKQEQTYNRKSAVFLPRVIPAHRHRQRDRRTPGRTWADGRDHPAPSRIVAFVLGYAGGLFCPALRAEFPFVHRTAGTGPAVRCGPGLAALRAEFSGDGCTAGTLPALCCRLGLRLFAAAVRAEAAGDAALVRRRRSSQGRQAGRGYRCGCGAEPAAARPSDRDSGRSCRPSARPSPCP